MSTTSYKRTYSLPFTFDDVLKLIRSFSIEDKVRLEKELEKETLVYRAQKLSEKIKPNDLSIDDVVAEVKEYRKKPNAKGSIHSRQ
jgi:ribosomal protein L29